MKLHPCIKFTLVVNGPVALAAGPLVVFRLIGPLKRSDPPYRRPVADESSTTESAGGSRTIVYRIDRNHNGSDSPYKRVSTDESSVGGPAGESESSIDGMIGRNKW